MRLLPAPRGDHPAEPGRHQGGHGLRVPAPRPARHLLRRHRRDDVRRRRWCCSRRWSRRSSTSPQLLGLLYTAEIVGAMVATALSGWTARVHHHGRAIVIAAAVYGAMIALAGADAVDLAGRALPRVRRRRRHDLRRSSAPPCGARRSPRRCAAGWPASRCCPTRSARSPARSAPASPPTSGRCAARSPPAALACVAGVALTAAILRDFWSYDARTDEHAVAEREVRRVAGEE